jgi:hypothetical protein
MAWCRRAGLYREWQDVHRIDLPSGLSEIFADEVRGRERVSGAVYAKENFHSCLLTHRQRHFIRLAGGRRLVFLAMEPDLRFPAKGLVHAHRERSAGRQDLDNAAHHCALQLGLEVG